MSQEKAEITSTLTVYSLGLLSKKIILICLICKIIQYNTQWYAALQNITFYILRINGRHIVYN